MTSVYIGLCEECRRKTGTTLDCPHCLAFNRELKRIRGEYDPEEDRPHCRRCGCVTRKGNTICIRCQLAPAKPRKRKETYAPQSR